MTHEGILRVLFVILIVYIKKPERSHINNLMLDLKTLEKQEQITRKKSS